jgi:hypothetical protein
MKQCRSGLHIRIRNCRRYSCAHINGHSKNFSSPQAAKVARTPGSSIATASRSWDQSRSRQPIGIVHKAHLQPHKTSPKSATWTINNIKKISFTPVNLASKARLFNPQAHTHARLFTPQARTCACLFTTQARSQAPVHYTGALSGTTQARCSLTGAHMCAPVQPTGTHIVRALYPLTSAPMHTYLVGRHARVRAYFPIAHARGAHTHQTLCTALRTAPAQKMKP